MAFASHQHPAFSRLRHGGTIAALTASLMLGACGQSLTPGASDLLSINGSSASAQQAQATAQPATQRAGDDLQKATDYWGKQYGENPRDLKTALSYARNLKAMGEKRRALAVLQQASFFHGQDRELASEYGRLALDLDQVSVAKKLLEVADDPARPDWRVISARGAALAKEGNYNDAIPLFERALSLAHNQPSVLSNLALAYAMNGESTKAESMLRQAAASDSNSPRIRQNLALVLGLQGKYDEAKLVAARDIPMPNASENADYLRQVVKLDPKSVPNSDPQPAEWNTEASVAEAPVAGAVPVQKVADVEALLPIDPKAVQDTAWVVATDEPVVPAPMKAATAPASKLMSVAEMAAQLDAGEGSARVAKPKKAAAAPQAAPKSAAAKSSSWSPMVAQAKR
jgi:Flp pilus assembly protein TadD